MGWAGVALSAVGGIMGAMGQAQAGKDAQKAEEYNAGVLRANAQAVQLANKYEIAQIDAYKKRFLSQQQAGYGASGVKSSQGSPLDVMIDSAANFEMEKMLSKYNAQTQAAQQQNEANQRIKMGKAAVRAGNAQATSTLLSTGAKTATSVGNYKTTGKWVIQ